MKLNESFSFINTYSNEKEIGIEIEVEGDHLPDHVLGWKVVNDASLRGESFEYVSRGPIQRNKYENMISRVYDKIDRINQSDRAGVHIHLNVQEEEINTIFNIITCYLIFENVLMKWAGPDREGNLFCLRIKDAPYFLKLLIEDKKIGKFKNVLNLEQLKYASINTAQLNKYGSLEFRGLGTPKDKKIIFKWIEFILAIKDYCKENNDIRDLLYKYSINSAGFILKEVFKNNYKEFLFKDYEELIDENIKKVQLLAYTELKEVK